MPVDVFTMTKSIPLLYYFIDRNFQESVFFVIMISKEMSLHLSSVYIELMKFENHMGLNK